MRGILFRLSASDVFTLGLILGEILGAGHPAAPSMDTYDDQVKNGWLKPVVVQKPIEGVADLEFLCHVVNACFRPEPQQTSNGRAVAYGIKWSVD